MERYRPTHAEINLEAIRTNLRAIKMAASQNHSWLCPMVKGNAYGHGAVQISRQVVKEGVDAVGVALVEEGLALREGGVTGTILVFGWFSEEAARVCITNSLTPVISRVEDLRVFKQVTRSDLDIHLKFNTGMNRLGIDLDQLASLRRILSESKQLRVHGICSHLAQGEDWHEQDGFSQKQAAALKGIAADFPNIQTLHLLNSAALLSGAPTQGFGVRPGISLYGAGDTENRLNLRSAMCLKSALGAIHHIKKGEGVSYNFRWHSQRDALVGVVPVGYADGYMRILTNRGFALLRGERVPLVGTVCMDYIILDLTDLVTKTGPVTEGEVVTLFGEQGGSRLPADEVAVLAETIPYEIFTAVSNRVPRLYKNGD